MKVDLFDFELPRELIALRPAADRAGARFLVVKGNELEDRQVSDIVDYLRPGDVMVFNDTRVIPARLTGKRRDAKIELTLHMNAGEGCWKAFAKPAKKLKPGDVINFQDKLAAEVLEKGEAGEVTLQFDRQGTALREALDEVGVMPLPPYIASQRPVDEQDLSDYQTVYSEKDGAVAAPTAGLHFTDELLAKIDDAGVERLTVTLHVGAGTFLPVKAEDTEEHKMHAEWGEITPEVADKINAAHARGNRVIAVGTTSLRLLESATDEQGVTRPFSADTDIFITPGYRFRCVDVLMTNFHLPKSTLFMLVSAFAGFDNMKAAYAHAIDEGYRFYSYGDSSLLCREDQICRK
ncbi:tRNA preQ1(34) S-adenosylmethionine ribosyltransferase-isomerase QueA [Emcibacter nanhaiensis]|uniref:S-adenosylmethionine:tRNA ribosyltransferase-isomerase n=1 Tax=Emcibacter nanhaiensis TaxID=1505037 RepID=A0A501PRF8_9PROT|nr:tRNA preQ1(34) S-adenosylmethionine ribosyltransferase-isomerase QueA [Emcibacter nanhaiensis]TPD63109.1 tRNA preQ1(34) S-adenosylmethionine ribosyltransferase-isomerase QueA [Emcibacter nanhaiensis]